MSSIIDHPLVTEKAMDQMDFDNKLQFIVDIDATKPEIADAIELRYDVEITAVNTQITARGEKKAVVALSADDDAQEIASRIGVF
jgi:large subunit ribosomal protein L23